MDKKDALDIALKYANAVNAKYDLVKNFLFGSYAKGNYNRDSNIGIAGILKDYSNLMEIQLD